MGTCHNPWCPTQGGRAQPHIPASAAPVSWRSRATPRKSAPQNFLVGSREILWRCVMSIEAQEVPEAIPERDFGSLRGCLVEGPPGHRRRERRMRRRSLAISVALQSAILAAAVLLSLFGKAERIVFAKVTPVPPYAPYRDTSHNSSTPRTHPNGPPDPCHYCAPLSIPHTVATHVAASSAAQTAAALPAQISHSIPAPIDHLIT